MPAQHARGYAFGEAELKDALGVLGFDRDPLVDLLAVVLAGELFEKGGGRELLFIADDDELVGARDGAERIDGLDLARFVHHQDRSEEHTSELQSLMRISYAVFCLKKKTHRDSPSSNLRHLTPDMRQPTTTTKISTDSIPCPSAP